MSFGNAIAVDVAIPSGTWSGCVTDQHRHTDMRPDPWEVINGWELGFFDGAIIEAIAQWRLRPTRRESIASLFRARDLLNKLIELETRKSLHMMANRYNDKESHDAAKIWLSEHAQ